ncbi:hypothetical protein DFH09DRAFT_1104445 [Mycena vulgaris]|nr:hypothetical protein DFH09DRAFT_1104445 [Mycena vulgaris]
MFLRSLVSRAAPHPLTVGASLFSCLISVLTILRAVLVERSVAPKSMGGALEFKNINGNALAPRVEAMPDPSLAGSHEGLEPLLWDFSDVGGLLVHAKRLIESEEHLTFERAPSCAILAPFVKNLRPGH